MFTRMLEHARRAPERFTDLATKLFQGMAKGGSVGIEPIDWFNGGLFDDDEVLPLERSDIDTVLTASKLDWSEIDPSILGTLFERGLDPGKRAQLGAHYTDRDKIMLIVEPVVVRPWLAEWTGEKAGIAAELERAQTARSPAARTKRRNEAESSGGGPGSRDPLSAVCSICSVNCTSCTTDAALRRSRPTHSRSIPFRRQILISWRAPNLPAA